MTVTDTIQGGRRGATGRSGRKAASGPPVPFTPIPITARTRTILAAVTLLAPVWLAWRAPTVPRLLLFGGALALIPSFPVRMLQRLMPRAAAIGVVVVGLLMTALVLLSLTSLGFAQLSELAGALPGYDDRACRGRGRSPAWRGSGRGRNAVAPPGLPEQSGPGIVRHAHDRRFDRDRDSPRTDHRGGDGGKN